MINNSKFAEHVKETSSGGFRLLNGSGMLQWHAIKCRIINDAIIVIAPWLISDVSSIYSFQSNIFFNELKLIHIIRNNMINFYILPLSPN